MITVRITSGGAVDCRAVLRIPLSAGQAWGQIRDFRTFARKEMFHAGIDIEGGVPRAGAALRLTHRYFLFRVARIGRICRWKERDGFAFSDLSRRGPRRGFPHTFGYRIRPVSPITCDVEMRVAGKWTPAFVPHWLARLWLRWIMTFVAQRVENRLLAHRLWLARRQRTAPHSATASNTSTSNGSSVTPSVPPAVNSSDCNR